MSKRSSIWLRVKLDVLSTTSIMTKVKYMKGISSLQRWSIKCVAIYKSEYSSWYGPYSYVILGFMNCRPNTLIFAFFAKSHIYKIWCKANAQYQLSLFLLSGATFSSKFWKGEIRKKWLSVGLKEFLPWIFTIFLVKKRLSKIKYSFEGSIPNVDLGLFYPNNQLMFRFVTFWFC